MIEIMRHLDYKSLKRFCLTHQYANTLCQNPKFYLHYNMYDDENEEYDYDDDFIWQERNKKSKQDLENDLEETQYYINQYHIYKNKPDHPLF